LLGPTVQVGKVVCSVAFGVCMTVVCMHTAMHGHIGSQSDGWTSFMIGSCVATSEVEIRGPVAGIAIRLRVFMGIHETSKKHHL
jgi:hypothetical protein